MLLWTEVISVVLGMKKNHASMINLFVCPSWTEHSNAELIRKLCGQVHTVSDITSIRISRMPADPAHSVHNQRTRFLQCSLFHDEDRGEGLHVNTFGPK